MFRGTNRSSWAPADADLALVRRWVSGEQKPRPLEAFELWGPVCAWDSRRCSFMHRSPPKAISAVAADYLATLGQRTEGWLRARVPEFNGSEIGKKTGLGYCGRNESPADVMMTEFLIDTEQVKRPRFQNAAMQYGKDMESMARDMYCWTTGVAVAETNMVICREPGRGHFAASPDGLVDADGTLELKVSKIKKFTGIPDYYLPQVMMQMKVTERAWCDFVALYLPNSQKELSENKSRLMMQRVYFSADYWNVLEATANAYAVAVCSHRRCAGQLAVTLPAPLDPATMPPLTVTDPVAISPILGPYLEEYSRELEDG